VTESVLASWNDGPVKQAILDFVDAATTPGAAFVEPADRIATFDNDGTLWVEQPMPPQFDFVFRKWEQEIKDDPSLAEQQPYKALIDKDQAFFEGAAAQDPQVVETFLKAFGRSWMGTTPEEFDAQVHDWMRMVSSRSSASGTSNSSTSRCWNSSTSCARAVSECSCAPGVAATSCGPSPRRPRGSTRRTSSARQPSTSTPTERSSAPTTLPAG